jgi:PAS domain S-box-containing protein
VSERTSNFLIMSTPVKTNHDSTHRGVKTRDHCSEVFATLGRHLSEATTVGGVAEIILGAADDLLGWDCCSVDLFTPESDTTRCVLAMDIVDGRRTTVTPGDEDKRPSAGLRRVICDGPQLILREGRPEFGPDLLPVGDKARPSASLMFVPIRCGRRVIGVVTIQSYAPQAYADEDLNILLALADHGGGAIERIQAEGLLHRTEDLYRRAIGGAGAVPYIYDYRTRSYSFMGEGIEQMTGYGPREISGDLWARIIQESEMSGEAAGLDKNEAARRVQSGEIRNWRCDMRITTQDGKSRWLSDASVQNVDGLGRPIGSMGILVDITERKHSELTALALSKLGQRLVSATRNEQAARILSEVAGELFGWDAFAFYLYLPEKDQIQPVLYMDTLEGKRVEVAPPKSAGKPSAVNRRVIERGAELTLRDATAPALDPGARPFGDKSRASASIMRVPIHLRSSQVTGVVSLHSYTARAYSQTDLKALQSLADSCGVALERIWADAALRRSESQFRLVWDSSADGMRLTNRDGIILRVNDAYCGMVEKSRTELEGKILTIVHSAANADFVLGTYQKRVDSKTLESHLETEVTLWNGRDVWFELSNSLLEVPGQAPLVLSIFRDITQRKQGAEELEQLHRRLLEVSRQAGMAEVATSVLHNVGNVLNSVNVSSSLLSDKVRHSKVTNLIKAARLLQGHADDLADFLARDDKGRQLPGYLCNVAEHLATEHQEILEELGSLSANIDHIKEIVAMQQSYARVLGVVESLPVAELVEDALRLNSGAMERHRVKVIREYSEVPPILVDKHKVLQILVNLIRNAKYALDDRGHTDKEMILRIGLNGNQMVKVAVIDNGVGIAPEHLTRIFEHGFTTRKEGHGFGLHNGALAAKELGGSLTAHSEGPGRGAAFTLELPCRPKTKGHDTGVVAKRV